MGTIPTFPTITDGQIPTGATFAAIKAERTFWANPPKVSTYQTTVTSVAYNSGLSAGTAIGFDTEIFDVANNYDGGGDTEQHNVTTNNTRVFARTTGRYRITAQVQFAIAAGGNRLAAVRLNAGGVFTGGTSLGVNTQGALSGNSTSCAIPGFIYPLTAGDYVEVFGAQSQTAATALNTVPGLGNTFLLLELVSA